ncbi:hypothetical protein [Chondrinema litorale]|uniref:hypothetical protein n=1 Tax=Chondrinema litorale TaxID=2994555 RepID=UPI002543B4E3|nr:hypothetical protein [Chondrinema litorale]UZR96000.1 hypothetical protein OQ292_09275 [Chondrinema litorale]
MDLSRFKDQLSVEQQWDVLTAKISRNMGVKKPDLNAVLFLIGIQELGQGMQYFSKEEKQDLMHIAICKALSFSGYYELIGLDDNGWPHWELKKKLPFIDLLSQEDFLKMHIIEYFEKEVQW